MAKYYFPQERLSVLPLVRALPARPLAPQPLKEFHVQIPGCTELAGCAVKDKKVKLTAGQAQYWLDQGALGEAAGDHQAGGALGLASKEKAKKTKK